MTTVLSFPSSYLSTPMQPQSTRTCVSRETVEVALLEIAVDCRPAQQQALQVACAVERQSTGGTDWPLHIFNPAERLTC